MVHGIWQLPCTPFCDFDFSAKTVDITSHVYYVECQLTGKYFIYKFYTRECG